MLAAERIKALERAENELALIEPAFRKAPAHFYGRVADSPGTAITDTIAGIVLLRIAVGDKPATHNGTSKALGAIAALRRLPQLIREASSPDRTAECYSLGQSLPNLDRRCLKSIERPGAADRGRTGFGAKLPAGVFSTAYTCGPCFIPGCFTKCNRRCYKT